MSKTLRYDALLARGLATELHRRLAGARIRSLRFEAAELTVRIATGRGTLVWDLRLQPGGLRLAPGAKEAGNVPLPAGGRVAAVRALPDERIVEVRIEAAPEREPRRGAERLVIELFGPHANAFAIDAGGTVLAALRRGLRERALEPGQAYVPPRPSGRSGRDTPLDGEAFAALLAGQPEAALERSLVRHVAWTSPINASAILAPALADASPEALAEAWQRYCSILDDPARPVLLLAGDVAQPYPVPLPGLRAEPVPDLMAAFERVRAEPAAGTSEEAVLAVIEGRLRATRRRIERLRAESGGASEEAAALRQRADLLLSQAHAVPRGETEALLDDYAGGTVRVELDPRLDAAGNAAAWYEQARRRRRAARRIPDLLRAAETTESRLSAASDRIRAGEEGVDGTPLTELGIRTPGARPAVAAAPLPYRRYRSRGGLEIRVGRGARANDELTLRHSRPEDIWLHARDAAGAHVVLVWGRRDQNPPETDLVDAAMLAALHSRARTSKTVPVDWARRKYVRKPRKSPPGTVVLERSRTLFVEPDPAAGDRLRTPGTQL